MQTQLDKIYNNQTQMSCTTYTLVTHNTTIFDHLSDIMFYLMSHLLFKRSNYGKSTVLNDKICQGV